MAADLVQSSLLEALRAKPGLPPGFVFSQSSLQDYMDCRWRFLLRYLLRLSWPAVQSEPVMENERAIQQGERFHRLAQQYLLGVPAERLEAMIQEEELQAWWEQFTRFAVGLRGAQKFHPEVGLSAPLGKHRLVAQFDLIVAEVDGHFTIFDWKTARRKPRRPWLEERLQTHVYPYLLARAGASLNGGQDISPENVEMVYWFPAHPDQPERFTYSTRQYNKDQANLTDLAIEIARRAESLASAEDPDNNPFPLTEREERCAYCVYRSLCERGERAGMIEAGEPGAEAERPLEIALDFEQIAEIEF